MSRKTIRVEVPENVDGLVLLVERILQKNDGVLQPVPVSHLPWTVANQLGTSLTQPLPTFSAVPVAPTSAGTQALPEAAIAPLRALYPGLKRRYLDLVALRALTQTVSEALLTQLGVAEGQSAVDKTKARGIVGLVRDSLLVTHADNEQALEGYGFVVTIGTAAVGRKKSTPPTP